MLRDGDERHNADRNKAMCSLSLSKPILVCGFSWCAVLECVSMVPVVNRCIDVVTLGGGLSHLATIFCLKKYTLRSQLRVICRKAAVEKKSIDHGSSC